MMRTLLVGLGLAATALAGCTGSEGSASAIEGVPFDETKGIISGRVTTDEYVPLSGATVGIPNPQSTVNTTSDGAFALGGLEPGEYDVYAQALGYESAARRVSVGAGQTVEVTFQLAALPVTTPYVELKIDRGYAVCDINAVFVILQAPNTVPGCNQLKGQFPLQMKETWRYGVFEAQWRSTESLHFFADTDGTCLFGTTSSNPCYEWKTGRSPIRLEAKPNWTWALAPPTFVYPSGAFNLIINGGGAGLLQKEISDTIVCKTGRPNGPECGGVGYGLGFAYNVYLSVFHHEAPVEPTKYSAIPDG